MGTQQRFGPLVSAAAGGGVRRQRGAARPIRKTVWVGGHGGSCRRPCLGLEPLAAHRGGRRRRCILVRHAGGIDFPWMVGRARLGRRLRGRPGRRFWRRRLWWGWRRGRRWVQRRRWWRRGRRRLGELVMQIGRLIRHAAATHWRTRMLFPSAALDAIEEAIARVESAHSGEIRFAIETALTPLHILNGVAPRARALEVFAHLHVWDTEHNNGDLIYVQLE